MIPDIWTIIPMRGIESGKSRLAGVLTAGARSRLNRWLLLHTLSVVERWAGGLGRCIVVTPCRKTRELAVRAGASVVREEAGIRDLNRALMMGASRAKARGAEAIMVVACDLPHLNPAALTALARQGRRVPSLVLAPDAAGIGTNALLLRGHADFEFRFGEHSLARHLEMAGRREWTAAICSRPELAFDLDTPEDLAVWSKRNEGRRFAMLEPVS